MSKKINKLIGLSNIDYLNTGNSVDYYKLSKKVSK